MKADKVTQFLVPITVVASSAVLLAALSSALSDRPAHGGDRRIALLFDSATGIRKHSPVLYAGTRAGSVVSVEFLTTEERRSAPAGKAVRITAALDPDTPPLLQGTTVSITAESFLGEKFVSLEAGPHDAPPLVEPITLVGETPASFDDISDTAASAGDGINDLLTRINRDYPGLLERLQRVLDHADELVLESTDFVRSVSETATNATLLVQDTRTRIHGIADRTEQLLQSGTSALNDSRETLDHIEKLLAEAESLVGDGRAGLNALLIDAAVVMKNLKVVSTYAKAAAATLGERPSRLVWGSSRTDLPSEQEILDSNEPLPVGDPGSE